MESFSIVFERFLKAVSQKQWDVFVSMLDPGAFVGALLPQGYVDQFQTFLESQQSWFRSETGSFEYQVLSTFDANDLAVGSVQALYQKINEQGRLVVLQLHISFWFRRFLGRWVMVYDQNTILNSKTKTD